MRPHDYAPALWATLGAILGLALDAGQTTTPAAIAGGLGGLLFGGLLWRRQERRAQRNI